VPLTPLRDHRWDLTPAEARALQGQLAPRAELRDRLARLALVAGIDIGFEDRGRVTRAAVAVLDLTELRLIESALARRPTGFAYVPGLLSFREIPAALDALAALRCAPDLLVCDGQGLAHPRRFGLACHLGWLLDVPAIGVAKSRLLGEFAEPPSHRGAWAPLLDRGEIIGAALRTRRGTKPVFVSPGHRVDVPSAVRLTLACTGRYRLPEPSRAAHQLASGDDAGAAGGGHPPTGSGCRLSGALRDR
jgi:deoxyribonuclease V